MTPSKILKDCETAKPRAVVIAYIGEDNQARIQFSDMNKGELCFLVKLIETTLTQQVMGDMTIHKPTLTAVPTPPTVDSL